MTKKGVTATGDTNPSDATDDMTYYVSSGTLNLTY